MIDNQTIQILITILIVIEVVYLAIKINATKIMVLALSQNFNKKSKVYSVLKLFKTGIFPENTKTSRIIALNLALAFFSYSVTTAINISPILLLIALLLAEFIALILIKIKTTKLDIERELPNILYIFARTYQISFNLNESIRAVYKNSKDEQTKQIFLEIIKQIDIGMLPISAMESVLSEYKSSKVQIFLNLISLNSKSGVDLPRILVKMAKTLERDTRNKKEVKNILFQTKTSSIATSLLVPMILVMLLLVSKNYFEVLLISKTGRLVLVACFFWYLIGVYMVNRILKTVTSV